MLANLKVRGSKLSKALLHFIFLYKFRRGLHRNYKGKHEFKTREVHEKCSSQNLECNEWQTVGLSFL